MDPELAKPLDHGLDLIVATDDEGVEVKHALVDSLKFPAVTGRRQKEPQDRDIENKGIESEFMHIKLPSAVTVPGPFKRRHRRCGDARPRGM